MKSTTYTLAFTFVSAVSFIYLFLAIGMVPYWQSLNGTELQIWWRGTFINFSTLMVPLHLLSIATMIFAFTKNFKEEKSQRKLWIISLAGLLTCQFMNFTLYGADLNPTLQSGVLTSSEALSIFDDWDFYHSIRTAFVCSSLITLIWIGVSKK